MLRYRLVPEILGIIRSYFDRLSMSGEKRFLRSWFDKLTTSRLPRPKSLRPLVESPLKIAESPESLGLSGGGLGDEVSVLSYFVVLVATPA